MTRAKVQDGDRRRIAQACERCKQRKQKVRFSLSVSLDIFLLSTCRCRRTRLVPRLTCSRSVQVRVLCRAWPVPKGKRNASSSKTAITKAGSRTRRARSAAPRTRRPPRPFWVTTSRSKTSSTSLEVQHVSSRPHSIRTAITARVCPRRRARSGPWTSLRCAITTRPMQTSTKPLASATLIPLECSLCRAMDVSHPSPSCTRHVTKPRD